MSAMAFLVIVLVCMINSATSATLKRAIPNQILGQNERHQVDLTKHFQGKSVDYKLFYPPANARLTTKFQLTDNHTVPNLNIQSAHMTVKNRYQMDGLWILTTDNKLYSGKFSDQKKMPDIDSTPLQVTAEPNVICYDVFEDRRNGYLLVDCMQWTTDKTDYINLIYVYNPTTATWANLTWNNQLPGLPAPPNRYMKPVYSNEDMSGSSYFIRYQEYKDSFSGTPPKAPSMYIEIWDMTDIANIAFTKKIDAKRFNLVTLKLQDCQVFFNEVFMVDDSSGVFRFRIKDIINPVGRIYPPIQYTSEFFRTTGLVDCHVYNEYFEGNLATILVVSTSSRIAEFDWTNPFGAVLLIDYELTGMTAKIMLSGRFVLAQTEDPNQKLTEIKVYTRNTRYEAEIFWIQSLYNWGQKSFTWFNPITMEVYWLGSSFSNAYTLNDEYLIFEAGGTNITQDMIIQATDSAPLNTSIHYICTSKPYDGTIYPSGLSPNMNKVAFITDSFRIDLEHFLIGSDLRFAVLDPRFEITYDFPENVTLNVLSRKFMPGQGFRYLQWEKNPERDQEWYIFLQNGTVLTENKCTINAVQQSISCGTALTLNNGDYVTSMSISKVYVAIAYQQKEISVYNKDRKVGGPLSSQCDDVVFTSFFDFNPFETLFCPVSAENVIKLFQVNGQGEWVVVDQIKTVPSPRTVYMTPQWNSIVFVKSSDSLYALTIGDYTQQFKLTIPETGPGNQWQVAIVRDHLCIVSTYQDGTIVEYNIKDIRNPIFIKNYPLFGRKIPKTLTKTSFDFSEDQPLLYVPVYDDKNRNLFIHAYYMGRTGPQVLYKVWDTQSSLDYPLFVQSITGDTETEYLFAYSPQTNFSVALQNKRFIEVQLKNPNYNAPLVEVTTLPISVYTSLGQSSAMLFFNLTLINPQDTIKLASTEPSANQLLQAFQNVDPDHLPVRLEIPDHLIFNGSTISLQLICGNDDDCTSGRVSFSDHFEQRSNQFPNTSFRINNIYTANTSTYILAQNKVFRVNVHNHSEIWGIIDVDIEGSDLLSFDCQSIVVDRNETFFVVACKRSVTNAILLALFVQTSFKPVMISFIERSDIQQVTSMKIVGDILYVLNSQRDASTVADATVEIYLLSLTSNLLTSTFRLLKTIDAIKWGLDTLPVSSFDVVLSNTTEPLNHVLFLMDPTFGLRIAYCSWKFSPYSAKYYSYSLIDGSFQNYNIGPDTVFHGLSVMKVPVPEMRQLAFILITTKNSNHFDMVYDITANTLRVREVYLRYAGLTTANVLAVSEEYFAVFAYSGDLRDRINNQVFLIYLRFEGVTAAGLEASEVKYKNVHSGLPYKATFFRSIGLPQFSFALSTHWNQSTNTTHNRFYLTTQGLIGSQYRTTSYNFLNNVTIRIHSAAMVAQTLTLRASNDLGNMNYTINISFKSGWFRDNLLWIILGVTVAVLLAAITIGCKICNAQKDPREDKLLEEPKP